jgi:predicted peroxiredoxin
MARILVQVTYGPENPTRAALAFTVAKSAIDEGHSVSVFLAGDAVQLIRDAVLDNLVGMGTGKLRETYDAIVVGGGRFYVSRVSARARAVTDADLDGKPAKFAPLTLLIRLSLEHDRIFTY